MTWIWGLAGCAILFGVFGLVMRQGRKAPGCDGCGSVCHRKESRHG